MRRPPGTSFPALVVSLLGGLGMAAVPLITGCGGGSDSAPDGGGADGGPDGATPDGSSNPDGAVGPDGPGGADAAPLCSVPGAIPDGQLQGTVYGTNAELMFQSELDPTGAPDVLSLELYGGVGTGTFEIQGPETSYATCSVCLMVYADYENQTPNQFYMAQSGTVTLTETTPNLRGTLTNVVWKHVDIDPSTFETTVINDGCQITLASGSFDEPRP